MINCCLLQVWINLLVAFSLALSAADVDGASLYKNPGDYSDAYAFDYRVYGTGDAYQPAQYFGQSEHRSDDRIMGQVLTWIYAYATIILQYLMDIL